jgi:capsular polysaccharide transport system permease protein
MTTKLKVQRFRTRRPDPLNAPPPARAVAEQPGTIGDRAFFPEPDSDGFGDLSFHNGAAPGASQPLPGSGDDTAPADIDAIRQEGLTGRELRMARRLAQKHGLPATSDFDAVRLLRNAGLDPFQSNSVLGLVAAAGNGGSATPPGSRALTLTPGGDGVQLPQTVRPPQLPSNEFAAEQAHIAEVAKIQRDIVARRRRKSMLLMARLFVFVGLPTLLAGIYYYTIATPLYNSHTEFVIQQAESASTGLGSLIKGSAFATSQDSIAVQGYLQSQDAMERLDKDIGFRSHFSDPKIDPITRIEPNASNTALYKLYRRNVKISYDPTEGLIKMEVIAADPNIAVQYSRALIGYAEEQVDQLTARLRGDQMKGALEAYQDAEKKLTDANMKVVELQEKNKVVSSEAEVTLITTQIGQLESQLTLEQLSLAQMESNARPNKARMDPVVRRIATLQDQIQQLRNKMTEDSSTGLSLAKVQSELLVAQADVATRQLLLSTALTAMEAARNEANRQTRYLSLSVNPVAADEAAYPLAFENTIVVMLIFAGIYLMISMTVAILHEQVTA